MGEVNTTLVPHGKCPCPYCEKVRQSPQVYQDAVCWLKLGGEIKVQNTEICERDDALRTIAEHMGPNYDFMTWEETAKAIVELVKPFLPPDTDFAIGERAQPHDEHPAN